MSNGITVFYAPWWFMMIRPTVAYRYIFFFSVSVRASLCEGTGHQYMLKDPLQHVRRQFRVLFTAWGYV
jgi:hypothetical protein